MIKTRIAAAGIVIGITASLFSSTAAQALPKGDIGCALVPDSCEEPQGPTTPTTPPKPPKNICQIIDCDHLPEAVLDEDPGPAQPEPTDPEPTQPTDDNDQPTTTTQPTGGQNGGNSTGNGSGKVTQVVRTVRVPAPIPTQLQEPVEQLDASPVASEVAAPQSETDESGLSSFEMLLIASTLGGAGFGLAMWLRGRKQTV